MGDKFCCCPATQLRGAGLSEESVMTPAITAVMLMSMLYFVFFIEQKNIKISVFWDPMWCPNPKFSNMWMQHACIQSLTQRQNCAVLCNGWHSLSDSCGRRPQRGTSDCGLTFLSATSTAYFSFCS